MGYVRVPIETDPSALEDEAVEELQARIPGWVPAPASPEGALLGGGAVMAAEGRDLASDVPDSIFLTFGASLAGLPPTAEAQATATATVTALDNAGYTLAADTQLGVRTAGDDLLLLEVVEDVVIPPLSLASAAGAVELRAVEAGAAANGAGVAGTVLELVEAGLDWVASVTLVGPLSGGADDEEVDAYLPRLALFLQLQSLGLVLAPDFALAAQSLVPGVDRALAFDRYKPADQPVLGDPADADRDLSVTVVAVDASGEALAPGVRAAVLALLQAHVATNFEVWLADPTYTSFDLAFTATAYPGWDAGDVQARAIAAAAAWLSPADWGVPRFSDTRAWVAESKVRVGEVYEMLNRVDGLWRVDSLSFGPTGGTQSDVDVTLAGLAPLPRAGAVTGAVSAP